MRRLAETSAALRALDAALIKTDGWMPDHERRALTEAVTKAICGIRPEFTLAAPEAAGHSKTRGGAETPKSALVPLEIK